MYNLRKGGTAVQHMREKFILKRCEQRHHVHVSDGDHEILMVYARMHDVTIQHCLHEMIGVAAKCWEEQHVDRLKTAEDEAFVANRERLRLTKLNGELERANRLLTARLKHQE